MGEFNHGNIQWDALERTGVEDQQCMGIQRIQP